MTIVRENGGGASGGALPGAVARIALLGNPNTGKTTLFNRLSGLRHKTSNFPGTTQEARVGTISIDGSRPEAHLIDLPGVYSLELDQFESALCREVLAGSISPRGEESGAPDAALIVADATNLPRNLVLVGEVLRRRLPTVVAVNMWDLARSRGISIDAERLSGALGCRVVLTCARSGEGLEGLRSALASAGVPNRTPPGTRAGLEAWADEVYAAAAGGGEGSGSGGRPAARAELTDRVDRVVTHPVLGLLIFAGVMFGLFYAIFRLATVPMDLIDGLFATLAGWAGSALPGGILTDLLANGVVAGIGATVIFLPQIALLCFLIALLEDTGYLARAAFLMDRYLRPFGLPGHAFVPMLSSHACALPGIIACRAIPDRRDRLAAILVAPFMSCSARIPVYVLLISLLFADRPALAAVAFIGCYALGVAAGLLSALVARRTILRGRSRPMALELPTYKVPSVRTALITTWDRAWVFLKNAGTNILAICIVLWWLGSYPHVEPPERAVELREMAAQRLSAPAGAANSEAAFFDAAESAGVAAAGADPGADEQAAAWVEEADRLEARHALAGSYAGRLGRAIAPVFEPLGFDWQLSIGVVTSFAAREVFVSTMAVTAAGTDDVEAEGVMAAVAGATRDDGVTPVFTPAVSWALLVYYVLAMQCLPTLAVTAREAGGVKWALLQLVWMCGLAYVAGAVVFQVMR